MTDAEKIERLQFKVAEAWQVIGILLVDCGQEESPEGVRALAYFSDENAFEEDFLPWPRTVDFT